MVPMSLVPLCFFVSNQSILIALNGVCLGFNTTKTELSQICSNSKLERQLVSIIYHSYQLSYLLWLFMFSVKNIKQSQTPSLSVHSHGAPLPMTSGRRLKTPATGKSLSLGTKYMFDSKIPFFYFSSLTYSHRAFEGLI